MRTLALLVCLALGGCATNYSAMPAEELANMSDSALVGAFAREESSENADRLRQEMQRRELFDANVWADIEASKVRIGMPEAAVWASWGAPDEVNTFASELGTTKQHIYTPHGRYHSYGHRERYQAKYVYTTNGKVTSIDSFGE